MTKDLKKSTEELLSGISGETIPWMTLKEKINLVLGGLKLGGFNDKIEIDDQFGEQGQKGLGKLLVTPRGKNPEGVNLMITIFQNLRLNPALKVIGGWVGEQIQKAVGNFQLLLKEGEDKARKDRVHEDFSPPRRSGN